MTGLLTLEHVALILILLPFLTLYSKIVVPSILMMLPCLIVMKTRCWYTISLHYLLTDQEYADSLRLIVLGTAGTGKNKMIQDRLCEIARDHDVIVSPVMLLAPTDI